MLLLPRLVQTRRWVNMRSTIREAVYGTLLAKPKVDAELRSFAWCFATVPGWPDATRSNGQRSTCPGPSGSMLPKGEAVGAVIQLAYKGPAAA